MRIVRTWSGSHRKYITKGGIVMANTKKYFVSGDQHYGITGQVLEIQRQMRMRGGSPLDPEKVRIALQKIIEPGYKEGIGLYGFPLPQTAFDLVLDRVRASGYLDTSFDGREVHPLVIRSLTKEQALAEYRASGGETLIRDELEKNMPYTVPKAEKLGVMILNFGNDIGSYEAVAIADELGVRPLTYEWLTQYGITHPEHQKKKALVGLGTKHTLICPPLTPVLSAYDVTRVLGSEVWRSNWNGRCRFPVVRK